MLARQAFSYMRKPCFVMVVFQDRFSQTICPRWPQTMILLISASWVVRITGMSHRRPAASSIFKEKEESLKCLGDISLLCSLGSRHFGFHPPAPTQSLLTPPFLKFSFPFYPTALPGEVRSRLCPHFLREALTSTPSLWGVLGSLDLCIPLSPDSLWTCNLVTICLNVLTWEGHSVIYISQLIMLIISNQKETLF
jgi:hypothetical protein